MFLGLEYQIAGRRLTLEATEAEVAGFGDPRAFLALARGAVGSPRLRSESFRDDNLDTQLQAVVADFATTPRHLTVDRAGDELVVSAVLGWRSERLTVQVETEVRSSAPSWRSSRPSSSRSSGSFSNGTRFAYGIEILTGV
jgi:hypothetical protein